MIRIIKDCVTSHYGRPSLNNRFVVNSVCGIYFACITDCIRVDDGDFEKGDAADTVASLRLIEVVAEAWSKRSRNSAST